jgi:hypothetical protein
MIRRKLLAITTVVLVLALYAVLYVRTLDRSSGRARGAGGFFHYREAAADWQAYVFIPAAFVESWLIRLDPKPFLPNPSWAELPQLLILQSPNHNFDFPASSKQLSTDHND